ncbi:phenylacetate--CoA ligase family protein [Lutibacter sp. HS1-25]|uniref:phenylacetate--CoA ligase family protein n=1 Tax=Lutibacter sp. HS1-25 TaxID=2485000 RepID=UPI001010C7AE|nr:phenylacetate--CoA ligase family protein [Lutibacter sp. HS1-25]RXP61851.1 phenylacetate--CoA ligase family protein [Lutibacter sp. HS1-25]
MKIYESLISTFYSLVKGDNRYKFYKKLRLNLKLSREELVVKQNESICKLINHAYYHTEYYRALMDFNNLKPEDIKTSADLMKLPVLTKQLVKNNISKLTSNDEYSKHLIKITSSGSTGEQGVIYRSRMSEDISRASWLRNNSMIGWMPLDKTAWIWASPLQNKTYKKGLLVRFKMFLNRKIILNSFNYSESDFPIWYENILRFKPKVLYGNSSIIGEFANFLIKTNLSLPTIKKVVCTTEQLRNRELIEKAFKCKVFDQYGSSEIVAIGIEINENEMLFTDDVVVLNINESQEFLFTPLFSFGFPLINYKLGDTGDSADIHDISKTYPFPIMNLKIGRTTDKFLTENNRKISTSSLGSYMAKFDLGIKEHKVIQTNYKDFDIYFIPEDTTNVETYCKKVSDCLEEYFGNNLNIKCYNVNRLPLEKSGKQLMFKRTFNLEI